MSISTISNANLAFGAKKANSQKVLTEKLDLQKDLRNEAWVKCFDNKGKAKAVRASSIGTIKEGLGRCEDNVSGLWGTPYSLIDKAGKSLGHIRLKAYGIRTMHKEPTPSEGVGIIADKINSSKPGDVIDLTA